MKICIKGNNDPFFLARKLKDLCIACRGEANVAYVDSGNSLVLKVKDSGPREALIKQQPHVLGNGTTLSSTKAAAKVSACRMSSSSSSGYSRFSSARSGYVASASRTRRTVRRRSRMHGSPFMRVTSIVILSILSILVPLFVDSTAEPQP